MDWTEIGMAATTIIVIPALGWAISVEKRLDKVDYIKETVEKTEAKVDKLIDKLL